jgi:type VI secretion system protein ImpH
MCIRDRPELIELVRGYVHDEFVWDLCLRLEGVEVPPLELGKSGHLGWSSWLSGTAESGFVDDLVFDPVAVGN